MGEELTSRQIDRPNHPWFSENREFPVILAAKPETQKNLSLLLDSVAIMENMVNVAIIGSGDQKQTLKSLAVDLGIKDRVEFFGVVDVVEPYLKHSDAFVLTSKWEGLSNILIEAMACGTQVVSVDCPSGPREVLCDGEVGKLVEMNPRAVADGITEALEEPEDPSVLINRAQDFTRHASASGYESLFRFSP